MVSGTNGTPSAGMNTGPLTDREVTDQLRRDEISRSAADLAAWVRDLEREGFSRDEAVAMMVAGVGGMAQRCGLMREKPR